MTTRIKDAGKAIRHSRGRILFHTAGCGNELKGVVALCDTKLTLRKRYVFVVKNYIEDVKQDEKHVPYLLGAIMRPAGLVKEELRPMLFKMNPLIQNPKFQGFNFLNSGNQKCSRRRPMPVFSSVGFKQ